MERASVKLCAESEMRARLLARIPAISSTTTNRIVAAKDHFNTRPVSCVWPRWCISAASILSPVCRRFLESGDFGEMEIAHLHGGDHHLEGFFSGCARRGGQRFDIVQQLDNA